MRSDTLKLSSSGAVNTLLFLFASVCLIYPVLHQVEYGWFKYSDYFMIGCALLILISYILPLTLRVNLLTFLFLILLLEVSLFIVLLGDKKPATQYMARVDGDAQPHQATSGFLGTWVERDKIMGYQPKPGIKVEIARQLSDSGQSIFEMTATIDETRHRVTPSAQGAISANYALFFGGSYTFGDGVNDDQTLPYYFSKVEPSFRSYNYGFSGYGPQHMLATLQKGELRDEVRETDGIALYFFIDGHVKRVIPSMTRRWVHNSPYYTLSSEGTLVYQGLFSKARPYLNGFYNEILGKSNTLRFIDIDIPPRIRGAHIDLACKVVTESFKSFKSQMDNDKFYFVIHPDRTKLGLGQRMAPCLEEARVKVIDYTGRPWPNQLSIEGDGHPSPLGQLELAKWLAESLRQSQ